MCSIDAAVLSLDLSSIRPDFKQTAATSPGEQRRGENQEVEINEDKGEMREEERSVDGENNRSSSGGEKSEVEQ